MTTLPDRSVFGNAPSGVSGRANVDYSGTVAPGRQMIESAGREGAGLAVLGKGMEQASQRGLTYLEERRSQEGKAALAEAQTNGLVRKSEIDDTLKTETDPERIQKFYPDAYKTAFESAGANLPADVRPEYDRWAAIHQQSGLITANDHATNIQRDADKAQFLGDMDNTVKAAVKSGPGDTGAFVENAKPRIEAAIARGLIDNVQGQAFLKKWTEDVALGKAQRMEPSERLAMLGGVKPGTVAATDLSVTDKGILNAIAGPESAGKYDARYTPNGGSTFSGFDKHPGIKETIPNGPNAGKTSDAAGRYQFLGSTWGTLAPKLGITDFSPASQDKVALHYAKTAYQEKTGHSLDEDIKRNGGLTDEMVQVLSTAKGGPWEGFNSQAGRAKALAAYEATVSGKPSVSRSLQIADHPLATTLPDNVRESLIHQTANEIIQTKQQNEINGALLHNYNQADVQKVMDTGTPAEGFNERIAQTAQLHGPEAAARQEQQLQRGSEYFQTTQSMKLAPNAELDSIAEQMKPREDAPDYADRLPFYHAAVVAKDNIIKQRINDSAGYADTTPAVAKQIAAYNPQQPTSFQNVVAARILTQKQLGMNPMPISDAEVSDYVNRGFSAQTLTEMRDKYGSYFEAAKTIVAKKAVSLGVNAPLASHMGAMELLGGDPVAMNDLATYQKLAMDPDSKKNMLELSPPKMADLTSKVYGNAFARLPQFSATASNAAQKLLTVRAMRDHTNPDAMSSDLQTVALQQAAGARYVGDVQYGGVADHSPSTWWYGSRKIAAPPGMRADKVSQVINSITDSDVDANPPMSGDGKRIPMSTITGGNLVSVAHGKYSVALGEPDSLDPQWVMGKDGKPYTLDLNEMEPTLRKRYPEYYIPSANPQSASAE